MRRVPTRARRCRGMTIRRRTRGLFPPRWRDNAAQAAASMRKRDAAGVDPAPHPVLVHHVEQQAVVHLKAEEDAPRPDVFDRRHPGQPALSDRPDADTPIVDKGYDGDRFRQAPAERRIEACILDRSNRKTPVAYDAELYKQRNRMERMFSRLKDWQSIATRYDRCAHTIRPMRTHLT